MRPARCRSETGIIEHDVETPKAAHRVIDCSADFWTAGDIGTDEARLGPKCFGEMAATLFVTIGDHHVRALFCEDFRSATADAACRTGDHHDLTIEPAHRRRLTQVRP